jgi:enoyl-CoA hydratase
MDYIRITAEARGHVFLMGLDRSKKRNAFDLEMYEELAHTYGELDRNPEFRCGVLFAHSKHFTSGLERDKWAGVFESGQWTIPDGCIHPLGIDTAVLCRKPLVMAIQGICFTIGFELLPAQDIRVASTDAGIALLEVKRGIYPVGGGGER